MKNSTHNLSSEFQLYESEKENKIQKYNRSQSPVPLKYQSVDTTQYSSAQMAYMRKLELQCKHLQKIVHSFRIQIKSLEDQNSCLKKICQKQHQKISETKNKSNHTDKNLEMIKEEHERQIQQMTKEKYKMSQLIIEMTEEHTKEMGQITKHVKKLQDRLQENQQLQKQRQEWNQIRGLLQGQIQNLKQQLDQKRNIEKKYRLAIKNLERVERSMSRSKETPK